jgi:hypothetical protein
MPEQYNPESLQAAQTDGRERFRSMAIEMVRREGLEKTINYILEYFKVSPDFVKSESENFQKNREQLMEQAGLLIANHPGGLDNVFIIKMLEDRIKHKGDVKILVSGANYEATAGLFPENNILNADDPRHMLEEIPGHIKKGGLFIIYPTGGGKKFHSGFRAILSRIEPETMIYTLNFNDIQAANVNMRLSAAQPGDPASVEVDEYFTTASEWIESVKDVPKKEQNQALTQHYNSLFNRDHAKQD